MIRIPVPTVSYATVQISLSGESYALTFRFNERMKRWKLDISEADGTPVWNGITLIEGTIPVAHLILDNFPEGVLGVFQVEADGKPAGRDNLGIGDSYELVYADVAELI